jgi:hypothetical protein
MEPLDDETGDLLLGARHRGRRQVPADGSGAVRGIGFLSVLEVNLRSRDSPGDDGRGPVPLASTVQGER